MFMISRAKVEREDGKSRYNKQENILIIVTSKQIGETLLKDLVSLGAARTSGSKLTRDNIGLPDCWLATDRFLS